MKKVIKKISFLKLTLICQIRRFMEFNNTNLTLTDEPFSLPRSVRFCLIAIVNIPSTICSLLLLYHLFTKRSLHAALHNHMIMVLLVIILFIQLIDMPFYLKYLHLGYVSPATTGMCLVWWYIDIAFYDTVVILLAWTSFERHILIYHSQLLVIRRNLWLLHYLPMIVLLVYSLSFYLFVLLIPTCDEKYLFDYSQGWCNYNPCYYDNNALSLYDNLMNATIPCLLIALFSILLLCRVVWTKEIRFHRSIQWRKYRKMSIQLFSIATFFVIFNLPLLFYYSMEICGSISTPDDNHILPYLSFLANFSVLLLPFIISFSFPIKIWKEQWQAIKQRQNLIHPN